MFDPYSREREATLHDNRRNGNVELFIDLIRVQFEDIYEEGRDNAETMEYISNLNNAIVTLENIVQEGNCFSVGMSTLSLTKYYR